MDWAEMMLSIIPNRVKARLLARALPHGDGWGGVYGEPPPSPVVKAPTLFATSSAVNTAVGEIADRVGSTPLHLFRVAADGERTEEAMHAALALLDNPNPYLTRFELLAYTGADFLLAGNAYWFLAGKGGKPAEIWRLNPRNVRLVRDNEKFVRGYVYEVDGKYLPLEPAEIIHFRALNPIDDFWGYGLPRLYAAALAATTGVEMAQWNRGSFTGKNVGIPAGIVNVQDFVSDADFERMKREWVEKYSGPDRKTAFIRGGAVTWQSIALSQKDVDFIAGMGWTRNEVFDVFRTYHLKSNGANLENGDAVKVRERLFLEGGLWPLLTQVAEKLTDDLLPFFGRSGALVIEFEDIRPRERALDIQEAQERAKGLLFNEWRQEQGLKELPEWKDLLFTHVVNQGVMPLSIREAITPEPPPQLAPFTGGGQDGADSRNSQNDDEDAREEDRKRESGDERAERQQARGEDVGDEIGANADKAWLQTSPADIGKELAAWERWATRRAPQLAALA